ncbi:Protein of unknown function [Bacillus toyonensis]|nr:Protein of unknown function [Bacillus toyonensis]
MQEKAYVQCVIKEFLLI